MPMRRSGNGSAGRQGWGRAALRSATLPLALALTTACQTNAADGPSTAGASFTVRYDRPSGPDADDAAFVRERRLPEEAVRHVTALVRLNPPVVMTVRSCDGEGPSYNPQTREVEICYDEISETRGLYQDAGQGLFDDALSAVLLESLFHESAHAVIDVLDLAVRGKEEDFADQFAALMLLRQGAEGEERLLDVAETWRLSAITYENEDDGRADEHSPDHQRAVDYLCYLYGAAPAHHADVIGTDTLPAGRARGCAREWKRAQAAWMNALGRPAEDADASAARPTGGLHEPGVPGRAQRRPRGLGTLPG
ncbi:DUF4344 domain-containing metallopeptidase [Streptomyces sp. NPDC048252]|uniref:DUF4344 domain-containing metallopeptidase n=1 Tax=Streptomyces sp. NPDC048252 TaxID=3154612 RepID=UPI0034361E98